MKRALTILLIGLSIYTVSYPAVAGLVFPTVASSDAITGKIVDGITGHPLPGVLIVATWRNITPDYFSLQMEGGPHYSCNELVNVLTAISGPDGVFQFPAWSGKYGHCLHMAAEQPFFVYYKSGYRVLHSEMSLDKEYDAGPDHTVSQSNEIIPMYPLGPHFLGWVGDNHVENLGKYAAFLDKAIREDEEGPCFWKEETPALLLLFQEERRLSAYAADNLNLMNGIGNVPMTGKHCTDAANVSALEQEAETISPEIPVLPYVRKVGFRGPNLPFEQGSALPIELEQYLQEARTEGHTDDAKSIVYHLDLNSANPYFFAMLKVGAGVDIGSDNGAQHVPNPISLAQESIYGYTCFPSNGGQSPRVDNSNDAYRAIDYAPSATTQLSHTQADTLQPYCTWIVALNSTDLLKSLGVIGHRDIYDEAGETWTVTDRSLVRPKDESLPGILEIHRSGAINVKTTLTGAGPYRWQLPPPGKSFTLTIAAAAVEPDADQACARILPPSLRIKLAQAYSSSYLRLMRVSDLVSGTTECPDVVTGDFTGKDVTGYAFHLLDYDRVWRLIVATPDGSNWNFMQLPQVGCNDPRRCKLTPATPGIYTKTEQQWRDPNALPHYANIDYGERAMLDAPNPGFIETWGAPIAYAHFFQDGKWVYVTVDAPTLPQQH